MNNTLRAKCSPHKVRVRCKVMYRAAQRSPPLIRLHIVSVFIPRKISMHIDILFLGAVAHVLGVHLTTNVRLLTVALVQWLFKWKLERNNYLFPLPQSHACSQGELEVAVLGRHWNGRISIFFFITWSV